MLSVLFEQSEGLSAVPTSCFDIPQHDNPLYEGELSRTPACSQLVRLERGDDSAD
jgi:hypothetical protein